MIIYLALLHKYVIIYKSYLYNGVWLSLVERVVRDYEAAGSNPVTPTKNAKKLMKIDLHGITPTNNLHELFM